MAYVSLPFCLDRQLIYFILSSSWAHEICSDDNEERALVVGSMNEMAYVFQAWLPQVVWQQVDAPQYRKGYIAVTVISAIMIGTALTTRVLHHREDAKRYVISRPGAG